jgi:glycerol-3-phosphate dehydrogenase
VLGRRGPPWTGAASLPGGDLPMEGLDDLVAGLEARHPWLPPGEAGRLARLYGTEAERILGEAAGPDDLGRPFGGGLTEAEVRHLVEREWAETGDDILWRRTKLGLRVKPDEAALLEAFVRDLVARSRAVAAE